MPAAQRMRAILVDPVGRSVFAVETDGSLDDLYRLIGCQNIEGVPLSDREMLYVDEEALLADEPGPFFVLAGHPHPVAGRGLILGCDRETGESQSTELGVPAIYAAVTFPDLELAGFTYQSGEQEVGGERVATFEVTPEFRRKDGA